jgi:ROK family
MSTVHRSQGSSVALLERLVLASFASSSGLARRELEELTGLSRTVVAGVVASLVTRGELAETLQPPTGGGRGRPPTRYQRTALLPPILLIQLRKDRSTSVSSLRGDGTCSESLRCAPWPGEWPTWSQSVLVNDANLAALGEAWFGAGRGRRAVFHICVADGIGAGFVFDGRLFTGAHGFSGEAELGSLVGCALAPLVTMLDPDCVVVDSRLAEGCGPFIAGVTTELEQRCPPDLAGTLMVVAGELDDAERYGALAAADAYAAALVSETSRRVLPPAVTGRA